MMTTMFFRFGTTLAFCLQVAFSAVIFVLLGSEDGFSTEWQHDASGARRAPALYNALFSTIAFILGAITSIVSGYLGGLLSC